MTEIEFLTSEIPQTSAAVPRRRMSVQNASAPAAIGFWALAALLAAAAPFRLIYAFRLGNGLDGNSYRPDGWGRLPHDERVSSEHGLRYGIVVYIAVGLLVLAAAALVAARTRPSERGRLRLPLVSAAAGLGAVFVLIAVVGEVLLAMQSLRDNAKAAVVEQIPAAARRGAFGVHLTVGWMVWLIALAALSGVLALVCTGLAARYPLDPVGEAAVGGEPLADDALLAEAELI